MAQDGGVDERRARFRALFDESYQPLLAYARRRCTPADADDLVAEVLTVAWRRLDDVPHDAALPWLFGVAHRTLANQRRSTRRRLALVERLEREPSPAAPDGDPVLLDALARLSADDQEVLRLAAWEQLRASEIAVVLGCSANAAALRLSRARERLRNAVTEIAPSRTEADRKDNDG
jgi:RNA polymerase sigma-70 factor (ECF subfamily)